MTFLCDLEMGKFFAAIWGKSCLAIMGTIAASTRQLQ
jgi:hypothetical protein